jgi:hypothetical protein
MIAANEPAYVAISMLGISSYSADKRVSLTIHGWSETPCPTLETTVRAEYFAEYHIMPQGRMKRQLVFLAIILLLGSFYRMKFKNFRCHAQGIGFVLNKSSSKCTSIATDPAKGGSQAKPCRRCLAERRTVLVRTVPVRVPPVSLSEQSSRRPLEALSKDFYS